MLLLTYFGNTGAFAGLTRDNCGMKTMQCGQRMIWQLKSFIQRWVLSFDNYFVMVEPCRLQFLKTRKQVLVKKSLFETLRRSKLQLTEVFGEGYKATEQVRPFQ